MSTDPGGGGRAGSEGEHVDRDDAHEGVSEAADVEREGEYVEREREDVEPAAPTAGREGEYTDTDDGRGDPDPPKGSYTDSDVPR